MYVNLPVHTVKGVPAGTSSTVIGQFFLLQRYRLAHFATTPHRATFREIERRVDGMKLHGEKYFGDFFRVNKLLPSFRKISLSTHTDNFGGLSWIPGIFCLYSISWSICGIFPIASPSLPLPAPPPTPPLVLLPPPCSSSSHSSPLFSSCSFLLSFLHFLPPYSWPSSSPFFLPPSYPSPVILPHVL